MANLSLGVSGTNIDPWNTDAVYGVPSVSHVSSLPEKSMTPVRHVRTAPNSRVSLSSIGSANLSFGDILDSKIGDESHLRAKVASFPLRLPSKHILKSINESSPGLGNNKPRSNKKKMKTTPKAADTSYHIRTRENTWQTVGQMKSALERPVTRRELLDLDKRFHAALNHVALANSGAVRDISQSGVNPIFEQDLIAMQADVSNLLTKLNSSFPQQERSQQEQSLVTTLFTQKWTDLIFGELADQLTVSCLEQGVLLQKLRVQYANNSQCLVTCYQSMVHKLVQAQQTVKRLTKSYEKLLDEKKHLDQTFEKKQAVAIAKLTETKDQEIASVRDEMDNLQALNDNLRTSLRTLNGIFSSMRGNQEAVRIGDLREANNRLQQMLVHKDKELESLRPLVDREKQLQNRVKEQEEVIEDLKVRLLTITNKLNDQSVLNKELISKESDRLESLEKALRKTKEKASHNPKGTREDLDNMAQKVSKSGRGSGKGDGRGNGKDGSLCVRCKRTLEASRNLDMLENHLKADLNKLPCTAFRILLPNLMGFRPERTNEWVIRCMRAIVFANQRANSLASRIGTKKMRMPEFVYAWFHPRPQDVMKGNQDEVMAQAEVTRVYADLRKELTQLATHKSMPSGVGDILRMFCWLFVNVDPTVEALPTGAPTDMSWVAMRKLVADPDRFIASFQQLAKSYMHVPSLNLGRARELYTEEPPKSTLINTQMLMSTLGTILTMAELAMDQKVLEYVSAQIRDARADVLEQM